MTVAILPVLNKQSLAEKVELLVQREKMRYAEAVIHVCEERGIDPIDMAKIIQTSPLKAKIERECIRLNTVKGKKRTSTVSIL
jgi:hypothetical protein